MIQFLNRGSGGSDCPLSQEEYNECLYLTERIMYENNNGVIVPIDFLSLDGTSSINLDIDVNTEYVCELAFKDDTVNRWECYLGTTDVSTTMYLARSDDRDNFERQGVTMVAPILSKIPTTEKGIAKIKFNSNKGKYFLGSVGDSTVPAVFDFYYLKIYNGDELIAHFIPAKKIIELPELPELYHEAYGVKDLITSNFIEYKEV